MTSGEHVLPGEAEPRPPAGGQDLVEQMKVLRRRARAQRHAYWFPLVLFGVLTWASVPFYWWPSAQVAEPGQAAQAGQGMLVRVGSGGWPGGPFFGGMPGLVQGYVAYYWLAALCGGLLVTQLWYWWHARRVGLQTPARGYLVTTAVLTGLALALPQLSQLRSPHWLRVLGRLDVLWPGDLTIRGLFPLFIIAAGLVALAWAERSRVLAITAAVYTGAAVLANLYDIGNIAYRLGWNLPPGEEVLPNVVLPGLVLLIAGAGACLARLRRRATA